MTNTDDTTQTPTTTPVTVTERRPSRKAWWIGGAGIVVAIALGATALGVSIADAADDDDDDRETSQVASNGTTTTSRDDAAISTDDRETASAAALAETDEGTVTDVDRSDDADHAWEVEVTYSDGRDVEVELGSDFSVVRVTD